MDVTICKSPLGPIELGARDGKLARVELLASNGRPAGAHAAWARPFVTALERYLAGDDAALPWDAMDVSDSTAFQQRVLRELTAVPFGKLVTYGELAQRVGLPRGARAVGGAVGSNPLLIFIPCHRVVAAGGGLGGFSAGLDWKARLLAHEGWSVREGRVQ